MVKTFEKIVSIDEYKFRITIAANESYIPGRWSVKWIDVKNVQNNKIVYRGGDLSYSNHPLKYTFKLAAKAAKKALEKNKETNMEIEEFEKWDGVINF
ncbi:hypothetical protein CEY02_19175 [Bacillus pumilus]|uniref:Uncharacterized protein n=1 Tax=Bacillus pumilus TaxID=1408 RepID=A0A2A5ILP2_BACPU|nr:hypothetical protein [Bacillus pumilus]PCK18324.1 hypothetical protein CEY02_19175 [Bacillus pumilus]